MSIAERCRDNLALALVFPAVLHLSTFCLTSVRLVTLQLLLFRATTTLLQRHLATLQSIDHKNEFNNHLKPVCVFCL